MNQPKWFTCEQLALYLRNLPRDKIIPYGSIDPDVKLPGGQVYVRAFSLKRILHEEKETVVLAYRKDQSGLVFIAEDKDVYDAVCNDLGWEIAMSQDEVNLT